MTRGRSRARTPEEQDRVRERFIECARSVFSKDGASGLTMRRLAAEAGYSPGTIYLYFPSRQDLLREVWKEDITALFRTLSEAVDAAGADPVQRLRALFRAYADFWFARPDHFKAMFLEVDRQYVRERAAFAEDPSVQEIQKFLLAEIERAMTAGAIRDNDVAVAAHSILAAVHGVVSLHISNPGFPWADRWQMVGFVLENLLNALQRK